MTATDPPGATAIPTAAPDADSPSAGGVGLPVPTTPAPDTAPDNPPPAASGWGWSRGYGRRGSALRQKLAAHLAARRRKRRAWARDIARIVLVVSIMALCALAVEIGRKAVVVLNRADLGAVHLFGERG
ncbi:hypothetical protein GBZ26_22495 [Azospirillum formosense]|uniref:Uncharacterized protein n=1 Tax=Azospirillum formosense TaxID=861533 RepID=A0ABX2L722_9PROT|nr:hypothetical protein [Azospirillum formosense]MBY3754002.1 hypothetical protein [Azospirillum formosense]NUB21946.1 hypothetical protein [Azospirillum formosense]